MKDSVLQTLDDGIHLRMAGERKELPKTFKSWAPEKEFEVPKEKRRNLPLFLWFIVMGALTAFFYVKFYM